MVAGCRKLPDVDATACIGAEVTEGWISNIMGGARGLVMGGEGVDILELIAALIVSVADNNCVPARTPP